MGFCILIVLYILLARSHGKLSERIQKCEQTLKQMKMGIRDTHPQFEQIGFPSTSQPFTSTMSERSVTTHSAIKPTPKTADRRPQPIKNSSKRKPFEIPNIIKENWMGIFGSITLVIGAVFFGLTAEIMQHAEVRVSVMMAMSFLFLGIGQRLKKHTQWTSLCGWLQSIAGAVILFTTIGAGGIEGLRLVYHPFYALGFLCFGISINVLLAMTTSVQGIASLHVILSIMAFCIVPQSLILLPIGAVVASVGLMAAYRSKWDLHLLLIVLAFGFQNTVWTLCLNRQLLQWMHDLGIGSSLVVSLIAACVHYRKKYQFSKWEVLPLVAHITNWGMLIWNLYLHAPFFKWTPFVLGGVAIAGFILARVAKKKKIYWLYHTDTLLSQLVVVVAIAMMTRFSIKPIDLGLIILIETLAFNFVCGLQKENFLLRVGCCLQYGCYLVIAHFTLKAFLLTPVVDQLPIYVRMGVVVGLSWGYHLIGSFKNFLVDDFRFVLFGRKDQKDPISIMNLFGTLFFIGIYCFGFKSLVVQSTTLSLITLLALWRKLHKEYSWKITFIILLAFVHIINWIQLVVLLQKTSTPSLFSRVDFLGLLFLDALLIFGDLLKVSLWRSKIYPLIIYALGIQLGLLTYVFTKDISVLIPGLIFLGLSVFTLELARMVLDLSRYTNDTKFKIKEGMTHLGLAFLIAFISRFITVHLQVDPIWHGISLRWITEALGLMVIAYWIAFYPGGNAASKFIQFCGHHLVEGCLGFITLCVVTEVPEVWRSFVWVGLAMGLLIGSLKNKWPKRLAVYSWMYLIASIVHAAFVTSSLTMPSLFLIEQHNAPVFLAIALQIVFAYSAYGLTKDLVKNIDHSAKKEIATFILPLYRQPSLTVLLPIVLGIALLFAFNFEKALLTLLWVGLTCMYLAVGLLVKSKKSIQIAMVALIFCSLRLIVFDLVQSDLATRALVFIGVGSLMLGVSILYKKYKYRIEIRERL